jgi:hypothetical protein
MESTESTGGFARFERNPGNEKPGEDEELVNAHPARTPRYNNKPQATISLRKRM